MDKNEEPVRKKESNKQTLRGPWQQSVSTKLGSRVRKEGEEEPRGRRSLSKEFL